MADVVGFRIVKERHACAAFSGEGARRFEGRWNSAGVRMVYCSESLALAALEILVHMQPIIPPIRFCAFRATWPARWTQRIEERDLPRGWDAQPAGSGSRQIGDQWVRRGEFAVLALPSVIVPLERTFLLNPQHSSFGKFQIEELGPFRLDQRLR